MAPVGVTDDTAGTSIRGDAQPEIRRLGVAGGVAVLVSAPRPPGERENQDGVAVFPVDAERGVLAVADGMGGGRGGGSTGPGPCPGRPWKVS